MKSFFVVLFGFLFICLCLFIYSKYPVSTFFVENAVPDISDIRPEASDPYGQWFWTSSINSAGVEIKPKDPADFILTLTPEGRLTSTTDCNTISGSYIQNQNMISVGSLVSTEKSCRKNSFESKYITQLTLASSFEMTGNALILYLVNNSGQMTFLRR